MSKYKKHKFQQTYSCSTAAEFQKHLMEFIVHSGITELDDIKLNTDLQKKMINTIEFTATRKETHEEYLKRMRVTKKIKGIAVEKRYRPEYTDQVVHLHTLLD